MGCNASGTVVERYSTARADWVIFNLGTMPIDPSEELRGASQPSQRKVYDREKAQFVTRGESFLVSFASIHIVNPDSEMQHHVVSQMKSGTRQYSSFYGRNKGSQVDKQVRTSLDQYVCSVSTFEQSFLLRFIMNVDSSV